MNTTRICTCLLTGLLTLAGLAQDARQSIEMAPTGLPAQIIIHPTEAELPLDWRGDAEPSESQLQAIGRGPQLRAPVRLVAGIEGNTVVAEPQGDGAWRAGAVHGKIETRREARGLLTMDITYGGEAEVELLELVFELAGTVDVAWAEGPQMTSITLDGGQGTLWSNAAAETDEPAAGREPGAIKRFFIGSGDRAFTFTTDGGPGWQIQPANAAILVERDEAGVTWRIRLVNHPVGLTGEQQVSLRLKVEPEMVRAPGARLRLWREREPEAAVPVDLTYMKDDPAAMMPMDVFRCVALTHTGREAQVRTNAVERTVPGASPAFDRLALGRAMLNDVGLDAGGLAQRVMAARTVAALHRFGYFADDGQTEYLPYWRAGQVVRFGEAFQKGDAFATTEENPLAGVYLSAWIRPIAGAAGKRRALFVLVNERPEAVREQLYILQPAYVFGGANQVDARELIKSWDFSRIPEESDWRQQKLLGTVLTHGGGKERNKRPVGLHDLMDDGWVYQAAAEDGVEVYGPVHVPAHSYRIFMGAGVR